MFQGSLPQYDTNAVNRRACSVIRVSCLHEKIKRFTAIWSKKYTSIYAILQRTHWDAVLACFIHAACIDIQMQPYIKEATEFVTEQSVCRSSLTSSADARYIFHNNQICNWMKKHKKHCTSQRINNAKYNYNDTKYHSWFYLGTSPSYIVPGRY